MKSSMTQASHRGMIFSHAKIPSRILRHGTGYGRKEKIINT